MASAVDDEIDAIRSVLSALEPLEPEARRSVLDYVVKRLGLPAPVSSTQTAAMASASPLIASQSPDAGGVVHIKAFTESKKPKSANEMAAVVAYFLGELVPEGKRKQTVNATDIKTYFKIADFPLPKQLRFTLPNAKNAGYFDLVGDGEYRLNAIGHNLVAHSLPRDGTKPRRTRKPSKPK